MTRLGAVIDPGPWSTASLLFSVSSARSAAGAGASAPAMIAPALAMAQRLRLPEIVGRLLASRGIGADEAERFLDPTLRDDLPDPAHLKDMDVAVERLTQRHHAAASSSPSSATTMSTAPPRRRCCSASSPPSAPARAVYVPDRQREGYGPNAPALLRLQAEGAARRRHRRLRHHGASAARRGAGGRPRRHRRRSSHRRAAAAAGLRGDQSRTGSTRPARMACSPRSASPSCSSSRSTARCARRAGTQRVPEPDLAAMARPRRARHDLRRRAADRRQPRAGGAGAEGDAPARQSRARRARRRRRDRRAARRLSCRLHPGAARQCRRPRRPGRSRRAACSRPTIRPTCARIARAARCPQRRAPRDRGAGARRRRSSRSRAATATRRSSSSAGEGWHPGVIGIVASRLKERYNRPACVVALADGIGKGSGRSVAGLALGPAVIAARQAGLLLNGGGHAMAAGFTVAADKLDGAARLSRRARGRGAGHGRADARARHRRRARGRRRRTASWSRWSSGSARSAPAMPSRASPCRICACSAPMSSAAQHVRCILGDGAGGARLKAIAFRCLEGELGPALLNGQGSAFHLAGHLRADNWQGRIGRPAHDRRRRPGSGIVYCVFNL